MLARVVPALYIGYMRLVERTSRVVRIGYDEMLARRAAGADLALVALHQNVFIAPMMVRGLGMLTMASVGDAGDIIEAMLRPCDIEAVRGGSSTRASRRTPVVREFLDRCSELSEHGKLMTVITPDGSRGPAGAVKPGAVVLAMRTGAEMFCLHVHSSRSIYAPTWDRTEIPLPFGTIWVELEGPIPIASRATDTELEACRAEVERRLHAMHARAFARHGREPLPPMTTLASQAPRSSSADSKADVHIEPPLLASGEEK